MGAGADRGRLPGLCDQPVSLSSGLRKLINAGLVDVRAEAVGLGEGESAEGGFPALDDCAFDEPAGGLAVVCGGAALFGSGARARLSSMSRMASQSSLMAASSLGKCPRFLMIFRSW